VVRGPTNATAYRGLLWAGLRAHHAEVTLLEAGSLLGTLGRKEVERVLWDGLRFFYPELSEDKPPDPPTPAAA